MDTLEETISQAKEKRKKADALETLQELNAEGVDLGGSDQGTGEAQHLAKSAQNVTDAMHTSLKAELVELHSFIPKDLLPSVYEIALIAQAAYKEQRIMCGYEMKRDKTTGVEEWKHSTRINVLDPITTIQNEMLVQEMIENARILMRQLAALNGFRAIQGEHNIGSLVAGVNAQLNAQNPLGLPIPEQQKGMLRRAINWVTGK
jgi:hypothetical protein